MKAVQRCLRTSLSMTLLFVSMSTMGVANSVAPERVIVGTNIVNKGVSAPNVLNRTLRSRSGLSVHISAFATV
jgi:hypothetical protein